MLGAAGGAPQALKVQVPGVWDRAPQANGVGITLAGSCRDSEPTRQQNVIPPTARMDTARTLGVRRIKF